MTEDDLARGAAGPQTYDPSYTFDSISLIIDGQTGEFISKTAYNYASLKPEPAIYATPVPADFPGWTSSFNIGSGYTEPGKAADVIGGEPEALPTDLVNALDDERNNQSMAPTLATGEAAYSNIWVILGCAGGLVLLLGGSTLVIGLRKNRKSNYLDPV